MKLSVLWNGGTDGACAVHADCAVNDAADTKWKTGWNGTIGEMERGCLLVVGALCPASRERNEMKSNERRKCERATVDLLLPARDLEGPPSQRFALGQRANCVSVPLRVCVCVCACVCARIQSAFLAFDWKSHANAALLTLLFLLFLPAPRRCSERQRPKVRS